MEMLLILWIAFTSFCYFYETNKLKRRIDKLEKEIKKRLPIDKREYDV